MKKLTLLVLGIVFSIATSLTFIQPRQAAAAPFDGQICANAGQSFPLTVSSGSELAVQTCPNVVGVQGLADQGLFALFPTYKCTTDSGATVDCTVANFKANGESLTFFNKGVFDAAIADYKTNHGGTAPTPNQLLVLLNTKAFNSSVANDSNGTIDWAKADCLNGFIGINITKCQAIKECMAWISGVSSTTCVNNWNNCMSGKTDSASATACRKTISTDSSTTSGAGTAGNAPIDCGGGVLNWIICPVIKIGLAGIQLIDNIIMRQLNINSNEIFGNGTSGQGYYTAWNSFRIIATAIIVIAGLIMVVSQAFGFEFLDAYTIRKTLPRLIIAVIGISLSWPIMKFMVELFNTIGFDIRNLMYSPFDKGGTISVTTGLFSTIAVAGIWFAYGPAALTFLLTAGLAVLVGYLILVVREIAIIALVILAPIGIACYVLPNTQKVWKMWSDNFLGLLVMFPIISALIAAGHIFAAVTISGATGNDIDSITRQALAIVAYAAPFFLLPLAARLATGVIGNIAGFVNNSGRGAFDRLKKARSGSASSRHQRRMNEQMSGGKVGAIYRRAGSVATPGSGALSVTRRGRANYAAYRQKVRDQYVGEALKNDNGRAAGDDDATALAVQRGMTRKRFISDYQAMGHSLEEANMALAQTERGFGSQVGTDAMAVAAFKARAGSSTAYSGDAEGTRQRINEGRALIRAGLMTSADATAAGKGNRARVDISGNGFANQMGAFSGAGDMSVAEAQTYLDDTLHAAEPGDMLAGNTRTITAMAPSMMRNLTTQLQAATTVRADGTRSVDLDHVGLNRALGQIAGVQDNLNRTSPEKAGMFADLVNGIGMLNAGANGQALTVRQMVDNASSRSPNANGGQSFLEVRKEYGSARSAHAAGADVPPPNGDEH